MISLFQVAKAVEKSIKTSRFTGSHFATMGYMMKFSKASVAQ